MAHKEDFAVPAKSSFVFEPNPICIPLSTRHSNLQGKKKHLLRLSTEVFLKNSKPLARLRSH